MDLFILMPFWIFKHLVRHVERAMLVRGTNINYIIRQRTTIKVANFMQIDDNKKGCICTLYVVDLHCTCQGAAIHFGCVTNAYDCSLKPCIKYVVKVTLVIQIFHTPAQQHWIMIASNDQITRQQGKRYITLHAHHTRHADQKRSKRNTYVKCCDL